MRKEVVNAWYLPQLLTTVSKIKHSWISQADRRPITSGITKSSARVPTHYSWCLEFKSPGNPFKSERLSCINSRRIPSIQHCIRKQQLFYYESYTVIGKPPVAQWVNNLPECRRLRRCSFDPWVGKIPWRRKWQSTPVFLPEKSHGQRSLSKWPQRVRHNWATKQHVHCYYFFGFWDCFEPPPGYWEGLLATFAHYPSSPTHGSPDAGHKGKRSESELKEQDES